MARKVHPAAKLKTLPEEIQEAMWEWFCEDPGRKLADAVTWLDDEHNIVTSIQRMSEWRGWYARKVEIATAESEASELEEMLSVKNLTLTPDQISAVANAVFLNRATKLGDAKTFGAIVSVVQRSQEMKASQQAHADKMEIARRKIDVDVQRLGLAERRVLMLENKIKQADEVMKSAADKGGLTPETRKAIREALGMEGDDA